MVRDPVAFSYRRFSTPAQSAGDSERRQDARVERWSADTGIPLDTSLTVDRGLSGWDGSNVDIGSLGQFLKWIEKGRVRPGDYLVIEGFDRATRLPEKAALRLLLGMTAKGVRIVTLLPDPEIFDEDSDTWALMRVIMQLAQSHGESQKKSNWVRAARAESRAKARDKTVAKQRHPAWLVRRGCGCRECRAAAFAGEGWHVLEARAETVRTMFRLAAEGFGSPAIAARLNASGSPTFGSAPRWTHPVVAAILKDGRAAGRLQPRGPGRVPDGAAVEGYYPAIIDPSIENAALAGVAQRRRKPGRTGELVNVFAGLIWDQSGGGAAMSLVKQTGPSGPHWSLSRDPQAPSDSPRQSIGYALFERAILSRLAELPRDLLDRAHDDSELRAAADVVSELVKGQAILVAMIARAPSEGLEMALRALDADLRAARQRLSSAEDAARLDAGEELRGCQSAIGRLAGAADKRGERLRIRGALRSVVERIDVVTVPRGLTRIVAVQVRFPGGHTRDYLVAMRRPVGNRSGRASPALLGCWSVPRDARDAAALDLRDAAHVAALRGQLEALDLSTLTLAPVE